MIRLASALLTAVFLLHALPAAAEGFDEKAWEAAARKQTASLKPQVIACQEKALANGRAAAGRLTVRWVVLPDGSVNGAEVQSSTLKDEVLEACVLDAVRGLRFPPRTGEVAAVPMTQSWTLQTKQVETPEEKEEAPEKTE